VRTAVEVVTTGERGDPHVAVQPVAHRLLRRRRLAGPHIGARRLGQDAKLARRIVGQGLDQGRREGLDDSVTG